MTTSLRILFIAETDDETALIVRLLEREGHAPFSRRAANREELAAALDAGEWDLIISDSVLANYSARDALQLVKDRGVDLPFIVVSERLEEGQIVAVMRAGAHDFLLRNELGRLVPAIERELREAGERRDHGQMQRAIRRGKMEWEAAFDAGSDLIIMADAQGRIIRCNRRVTDYFSCGYQDLLGRPVSELFYGGEPAPAGIFPSREGCTVASGEEEVRFPRLEGWYSVLSYPMDFEGEQYGMVHIVKDITRRRLAEEEKQARERELLTLYSIAFRLNSTRSFDRVMKDLLAQLQTLVPIDFSLVHLLEEDGLNLTNSVGIRRTAPVQQVTADPRLLGGIMSGTGPDEGGLPSLMAGLNAVGGRAWSTFPLRLGESAIGVLTVAREKEIPFSEREIFLLQPIANQLAVLIENHSLYAGMKEKTRELNRSRAELRENLEKMRQAYEELGSLNAAKNNFIGMASHELKTPMTSILGGVDFLLNFSDMAMTPEQRTILTSVHEGILQLKGLVDDLLSFSRLEMSSGTFPKHPHDLLRLSRLVADSFALPLAGREIRVVVTGEEADVPVDEGYFRLVMRNLLENAIKFTPDKGMIVISGRPADRREAKKCEQELLPFYRDAADRLDSATRFYRIDVTDSGIGIPVHERQKVFDKFYSLGNLAHHSSGKTGFMARGSGLGLAIVREIMESHGGMVWNGPAPDGIGTVFSLLFPCEEPSRTGEE